jgi:hypothetical protein
LRFLGIILILRVLRLQVSVYNVYITKVSNHFGSRGGERGVNPLVEVTVNSKEEYSEGFCPNYVKKFDLRGFSAKNTVRLVVCESWQ